ncbi:hypothetical protein [Methanobrevibacter sp. DSM 116169]|uniref:hypothetical protein n=1 Tax=Methanobrevibacter sp. DSM 116169 TaxID=3242727 RepID=UPI0038FCD10B
MKNRILVILIAAIAVISISGGIFLVSGDDNSINLTTIAISSSSESFIVSGESFKVPEGYEIKDKKDNYAILTKDGKYVIIYTGDLMSPPEIDFIPEGSKLSVNDKNGKMFNLYIESGIIDSDELKEEFFK